MKKEIDPNRITENDIIVKTEEDEVLVCTCKDCGYVAKNRLALAGHVGAKHKKNIENYVLEHYLNGEQPKCLACGDNTRFRKGFWCYKKYCIKHSNEGRKVWSQTNKTMDFAWRKGLTKKTHEGIKRSAEKMANKNNPHSLTLQQYDKNIEKIKQKFGFSIQTNFDEYKNNTTSNIKAQCTKCGKITKSYFFYFQKNPVCRYCVPAGSKEEKEVVDWLRTVYTGEIVENSRSIISPKELDIYLPEKRFAIEYNGLYWHSGDRIDKKAHLNKTVACKQQDIKLFHIFSDEWRDKKDIVKSMILYRIGMVGRKIPARKCELVVLDKNVGRNFFINTHISGDNRAQVYVGLKYRDEIVCAISMKKPIQKKYGNILEIARFSNALNTTVQGGFGKLFGYIKEYSKQLGYSGILTYADRRFGDGDTYSKNGFLFLSSSPVDYWYSDGIDRHFRFKYRAQKPLTEKQVAEQNGVFPVFGCGSNTYLYNF
jgi:hypothetical protein